MTTPTHDEGTMMPAFHTPEPILAIIDMATATVRVNAGDRDDTVVEIRPADEFDDADVRAAERAEVEYAGGRLLVRADKDTSDRDLSLGKLVESPADWARSLLLGQSGSVQVTIDLPAGSRLDVKRAAGLRCRGPLGEVAFTTSYGDIQVEQAGRLRLKTTYGDISVTRAAGHAEITTDHGDIRVGEIDGTAVIRNSHGEIRLREVTGELRLNTAHGDAAVDRVLAGVVAKTAYGSVRIGEAVRGSVVMETTGGGLELGIRDGSAAWLDVSSKYGSVDVGLDSADGPGPAGDVVKVRAHTSYGDIVIHRS
ncbi:DUF4097 family beta strand repeat-containing protein [Nonomuraea harbinensis]|uniref:DUF4097 domain-containing protein n=1 Tax=Nonomuraea harbinensis TaxID=1286938 RepID=A0ABW1C408_9ACTN|nr:DUF4097 family beta strand repeat-containing protein [Nonomuraea harbinensis]